MAVHMFLLIVISYNGTTVKVGLGSLHIVSRLAVCGGKKENENIKKEIKIEVRATLLLWVSCACGIPAFRGQCRNLALKVGR